jgi:hypothetical protein
MEEVDPLDEPLLDFAELKRRNIADNYAHLTSLIKNHGFPAGFWTSPNKHRWTPRSVREWLATRPTGQPSIVRARAAKSAAMRRLHCAKEVAPEGLKSLERARE